MPDPNRIRKDLLSAELRDDAGYGIAHSDSENIISNDIVNHDKSFDDGTVTPDHRGMASSIQERLRTARKRAGLTQVQLGQRLGNVQTTLSMRERGHNNVGIEDIKAIARETGADPVWLAFGEEAGISDDESALLSAFRNLTADKKTAILTMMGIGRTTPPPERARPPFKKRS